MRNALPTVLATWTLGILACGGTTDPVSDPAPKSVIRASIVENDLRLTNPTAKTIYYAAFEYDWATRGLFLWAPCADPASCPSAKAGTTIVIPYSTIGGYTPAAREAIVYYWQLEFDGNGYRAGEVRSLKVTF